VLYEIVLFKNARWQHVIVADRISRCRLHSTGDEDVTMRSCILCLDHAVDKIKTVYK